MKTKQSIWKKKLVKTTSLLTAILVAAMFLGTAAGAGIARNATPTEKNTTTSQVVSPVEPGSSEVLSAGLAPQKNTPIPEKRKLQSIENPVENPVLSLPFYASNVIPTPHVLWSFSPTTPGTVTQIGTYGSGSTDFLCGGTFANDGLWYACQYSTSSSNIYTINTATGALTLKGAAGVSLNGISVNKLTGIMYGIGSTGLYTINMATGAATLVGSFSGPLFIDIAISGAGICYGIDIVADSLYTINLATGATTLVGACGISMNYAQDSCFDIDNNILYHAAYTTGPMLYTINVATGTATLVGSFPSGAEVDCFAIPYVTIPPDHDVGINSIVEPSSGTVKVFTPNVQVKNFGNATEVNVTANLKISGKQVNGTTIDFEANDGGYTHAAGVGGTTPGVDAWEYGTPTSGPMAAHSGTKLWATILGGNYPASMYANMTTPSFVVPTNGYLEFWHWYNFESSWDGGNVKVSNTSWLTNMTLIPTGGYPGTLSYNPYMRNQPAYTSTPSPQGWRKAHFDFPAALYGQTVQLRFSAASDTSVQYLGWYIDDVTIGYATWIMEYNNTVTIPSILKGQTLNVTTFPIWTPYGFGVTQNVDVDYNVEARCNVTGDVKPSNDYLAKAIALHFGWLHDISVDKIVAPPVSGSAKAYIPTVNVSNIGMNAEVSVPVRLKIIKNQYTMLLNESFAGTFPPTGWTQEQLNEWNKTSSALAGGTSPEARLFWSNVLGGYAYLQTPAVDTLTTSILQFNFRSYLDMSAGLTAKVLIRPDSLTAWTDITPWVNPPLADIPKALYTLDISAYKGTGTQIMFEFTGPNVNLVGWYLDNVQIINKASTTEKDQTLYISPAAGAKVQLVYGSWTPADLHLIQNVSRQYEINVTATLATDGNLLNNKIIQFTNLKFDWFNDVKVNGVTKPISGLAQNQIPMVNLSNVGQNDQSSVKVNMQISKLNTLLSESFEGTFPPTGWTVIIHQQTLNWRRNDQWPTARLNYAGGAGFCADADADAAGSAGPFPFDSSLVSPVMDLSAISSATFQYTAAYNALSGDYADVDISINNGTSWTNLQHWTVDHSAYGPGEIVSFDLTPYCGNAQVKIRFHYFADSWDYYFEVDEVRIRSAGSIVEYNQTVETSINAYKTKNVTMPSWHPADVPLGANIDYIVTARATIMGYTAVYTNNFDYTPAIYPTFPPAGWTRVVHENTLNWQQNTFYSPARANMAGTGQCADADADMNGAGPWPMNCSLVTPSINLVGKTAANLQYHAYYYLLSGDYCKTEITTNGGVSWTTIKTVTSGYGVYEAVNLDLTAYCGNTIQIRFHYYAADWDYYWLVDDVVVTADSITMLSENFDGAVIPASWNGWYSTIISGTSTLQWSAVQTGSYPTCSPHSALWMAKYPSFSISSGSARLKYNLSFNLASYGSSKLALGFWMMHDTGYSTANDNVQVQVSTNNLTWTNVGTAVKRYDATAATPTWKLHYVDISAYAAGSTVWIAFLGTSFYGNNIYIDDMSINVPAVVPDAVPANNVLSKTVTLSYEHDVGVSAITQPTLTQYGQVQYDVGNLNALSDGGFWFQTAIRITPTELAAYNGWTLKYVQFYKGYYAAPQPACSGQIIIYDGHNATAPGSIITTQAWSAGAGSFWMNISLASPIVIDASHDYWIAVNFTAGYTGYPAGMDNGPEVAGKSDWILDQSAPWTEISAYGFHSNWNIRPHFETMPSSLWPPGTYQIAGIVKNFGVTYPETNFTVNAKVYKLGAAFDTLVYEQNVTVIQSLTVPNGTAPVTFPNITIANLTASEGNYRLEMKTMLLNDDHATNDKQTKTFTIFKPDILPPVTTHALAGTMGLAGWYRSNVVITLSATDPSPARGKGPSGVNHTYYKIDSGSFLEYTVPVTVTADGRHNLTYYSVDKKGNTEAVKGPFAFKMDKTAPVWVNYTFTALNLLKNKWKCVANVGDAISGIVKVEFYVDDALVANDTTAPYEFQFNGKPINNSQAIAYDAAGNSAMSPIVFNYEYGQQQSQTNTQLVQKKTL